jgi:hypothetical protein
MDIIKQDWFWTGAFSIIASVLTIIAISLKEIINRRTKIKLEKIKIYDEKKFNANLELYEFISTAYSYYWPPDDPRKDFIALMKSHFFIKVKKNYPYIRKDIREKLRILEDQYICLGEPDFKPRIPVDQFFKTEYLKILNELNTDFERIFDKWEGS